MSMHGQEAAAWSTLCVELFSPSSSMAVRCSCCEQRECRVVDGGSEWWVNGWFVDFWLLLSSLPVLCMRSSAASPVMVYLDSPAMVYLPGFSRNYVLGLYRNRVCFVDFVERHYVPNEVEVFDIILIFYFTSNLLKTKFASDIHEERKISTNRLKKHIRDRTIS